MSLASDSPAGRLFACAVAALFAVVTPPVLRADDATPDPQAPAASFAPAPLPPYWTNRGHWNLGAQIGFALENDVPHNVSHIQMLIAQPQLGLIVRDFQVRHVPVRRFEIINEGIFGNAVHPGGRLTGYAVLFRLDGKNHGRFVPFFDAGAGVQRTTLSTRAPELSGTTQFSPQGGFGVQYFFRPQRAFVVEWRYMHMSNAGITEPNLGFNASMITIGFRWLRHPA
jgi:lipid A 3-O-deacylase